MRIVLFDREEMLKIGGISVYTQRLCKYLTAAGHQVYIFRFSNKKVKEPHVYYIPYYLAESRSFIVLPTESSLSLLKKYLKELRPDIVYTPIGFSPLDFFLPSTCRELKIPLTGVWHFDFNKSTGAYQVLAKSVFLAYVSFCKQLDLLHVFSHKLANFYTNRGVTNRILILPNGINSDIYKRKKISDFAIKHKIKTGILFLGRLTLAKNPELLIRSFLSLNPPPDTKLVIIGCGDLDEKLKEQYKDKRIIFTGLIKDEKEKIDIMSSCQVFVLPSMFEGASLALLEAMSCQMACIVSDAGGNAEALDKAGIILPVSHLRHELPVALKICLNNPFLVNHLGRKARYRISKYYSQETQFHKLVTALHKTVRQYRKKKIYQTKSVNFSQSFIDKMDYVFQKIKQLSIYLTE